MILSKPTLKKGRAVKYYTVEDGAIVKHEVDALPAEIEVFYAAARQAYVIDQDVVDWEDDDTDQGTGYDYDESHRVFREPKRSELVIRDGKLHGFKVHFNHVLVPGEVLQAREGCVTSRHGHMTTWCLIAENEPSPADHICLLSVPSPSEEHVFSPADFHAGMVDSVVEKVNRQDKRGWFDGRARLVLKLSPEAVSRPDETLAAFAGFEPMLVKLR